MTVDTAASRSRLADHPPAYLAIAGERRGVDGRETRTAVNPVTGIRLGDFPLATEEDLQDALEATVQGFAQWSAKTAYERAAVLHAAADWMREHCDEGATRIALELGKVFPEAQAEIRLAASIFEWTADEALRVCGRIIPGRRSNLRLESRLRPIGPVYAVSSWNAPVNTPARKISGALAAGCSIILKLSDQTPTSGLFLFEALEAAGIEPGVVQVVTGRGAQVSDALIPSRAIRLVTLTGSIELGRQMAAQAGQHLKPQTMELGGHAPAIIHHDVPPVETAQAAARAKFRNVGQVCTAPTRFIVHESIVEEFTHAFVAETERIVVGDPFAEGSQIGPVQSAKHRAEIEGLVTDAREHGARILTGGRRLTEEGFFYAPTVITDVPTAAAVRTTEPFGPIALIASYSDVRDAVAEANSLDVGLTAYGFTAGGAVAQYLADTLQAGNIVLNNWNSSFPETPFGGVGDSGYGREGGSEGLREFLTTVFVSNEYPDV